MHGQYPARDDPNTLFNAVKQLYTQKAKLRDEKALVRPSAECASSAGAPGNNATPSPTTVTFVDFSKEGLMGMPALDDKTGWSKLLTTKHPALVRLKKDDTLYKVIKLADKSDSVNSQSINAHHREPTVLSVDLQSIDGQKDVKGVKMVLGLDSTEIKIKTIYCRFFGGTIALSPSITISIGTTIKQGARVKTTYKKPSGKVEVRESEVQLLVAMLDEVCEIGGENEKGIQLKDCPTIVRLAEAAKIKFGKPKEDRISTREGAEMLRSLFKLAKDTKLDNNRRLVQSLIKEAEAALAEKDSLVQKVEQLAKLGFLGEKVQPPAVPPTASSTTLPAASPDGAPTASSTVSPAASFTTPPAALPDGAPTASPTASPAASSTAPPAASPDVAPTASSTASPAASPAAVVEGESVDEEKLKHHNHVWSSIASYGLIPSLKSQRSSDESDMDTWYKQQQDAPNKAKEQAVDKALKAAQYKAKTAIRKEAKKETHAALKSAIEHTDDDFHSPASVQKFIDLRLKPKAKPITPSLIFRPWQVPCSTALNYLNCPATGRLLQTAPPRIFTHQLCAA